MKWRLWPRTLSWQLILVILLAVALSQVVTLWIYRLERAQAVRKVVGEECVGRAISGYRLVLETPPEERAATLDAIETPLTRYWITPTKEEPAVWQQEARQHLLTKLCPRGGASLPGASLFEQESMMSNFSDDEWYVLPGSNGLTKQPLNAIDLKAWNGFGFAVELNDGTWLNMVYAKPSYLMQSTLTPGYYTALVITVLIFGGLALFVARRISRPLSRLAKAAERLGRGEKLEVLSEEGPEDVRATIGAFNRMQIRLQRFLEDRTRLMAAIGHDLRTPITSLRLRTEFIPDAEMREKFNATLDEMQSMAEASLSFAQTESSTEETRTVELHALVESTCEDLAEMGLDVKFASEGRLPYPCRPTALRRALRNLIENAVRYGERARVSLRTLADGVEIVVEDDGPGISEEDAERVFQPFQRLEVSRNRDTGGVGLGLSIARSIVRNHGGDITLVREAKGFAVRIHLPEAAEHS